MSNLNNKLYTSQNMVPTLWSETVLPYNRNNIVPEIYSQTTRVLMAQAADKDWERVYRDIKRAHTTLRSATRIPHIYHKIHEHFSDAASHSGHAAEHAQNATDTNAAESISAAASGMKSSQNQAQFVTDAASETVSNSDDAIHAGVDATAHSDAVTHIASAGTDIASAGTDHADMAAYAGTEVLSHVGTTADAASVGAEAGSAAFSFFGPLMTVGGWAIDHGIVIMNENRSKKALQALCPVDFKIAADYARRVMADETGWLANSRKPHLPLTKIEELAFSNLRGVMERNGGSKILSRRIIRDVGTPSGVIGGPGGGIAVTAMMTAMEQGEGIPSLEEITTKQIGGNIIGGTITLVAVLFNPLSLAVTVPAMVSGNVAASKFYEVVKEWHETMSSPQGMREFLFKTGQHAQQIIARNPNHWTEIAIRKRMINSALLAADSVATRNGAHHREEVHMLLRFGRSAATFFNKTIMAVDFFSGAMAEEACSHAQHLLTFCGDARLADNEDLLLNVTRNASRAR